MAVTAISGATACAAATWSGYLTSGAALDLAFVKVITARDRVGGRLAATEVREGSLPAIRQLAQQLLAEQQARTATLQTWRQAWSYPHPVGHRLRSSSIPPARRQLLGV
jgi:uncharacterized protein (DUF305 family)